MQTYQHAAQVVTNVLVHVWLVVDWLSLTVMPVSFDYASFSKPLSWPDFEGSLSEIEPSGRGTVQWETSQDVRFDDAASSKRISSDDDVIVDAEQVFSKS